MELKFEALSFTTRLKRMLHVDVRRMFTMPLLYIIVAISFIIPILILVMTSMMPSTTIDPVTGIETPVETFTNTWQAIGSLPTNNNDAAMSMSLVSMCNINMMYFGIAVLVAMFVSADFRSGYNKNLFTVRSKKLDYVISKTIVCFIGGALMIIAFFIGSMLGGAFAGLSFDLGTLDISNIIMCMISKVLIVLVFVPIFLVMSVAGKQRAWLSLLGGFGVGMLLFTMVPMITPLEAGVMNVLLCLLGGLLFSIGIGAISNLVLKKTSLV